MSATLLNFSVLFTILAILVFHLAFFSLEKGLAAGTLPFGSCSRPFAIRAMQPTIASGTFVEVLQNLSMPTIDIFGLQFRLFLFESIRH